LLAPVRGYDVASSDYTLYSRWWNGDFVEQDQSIQGLNLSYRRALLDGSDALHVFWSAQISIPGCSATAAQHQCLDDELVLAPVETPSGYASTASLAADADRRGWFGLGWVADNAVQIALWNTCTLLSAAAAPAAETQSTSLEALAVDGAANRVCVVRKQFLRETREVVCAVLR
jgi:hypothetical protein